MDRKIKIIMILVMVFGVITSVGTYLYLNNLRHMQERLAEENKMQVVILKEDIVADTCITEAMVEVRRVDKTAAVPDKVISKKEDAIGKYVKSGMYAGEILRKEELMDEKLYKEQITNMVGDGMRAISVLVDADTGVAGLLYPGSYVDVIFTYTDDSIRQANLLLENKRVLALDGISSEEKILFNTVTDSESEPFYQTVTLEVTPPESVRLALAMKMGEIRLVLRSQQDQIMDGSRVDLSAILGTGE